MKISYAILLFLCLAFKPVYNVSYVAYYELNIDYIIETYCVNKKKPQLKCNGKCHLSKQLSYTTVSTTKDSTPILKSFCEAFYPVYFEKTDTPKLNLIAFFDKKSTYGETPTPNYKISIPILSPPPQV